MGYEVHITRAEEWSESEANPITFEEWRAYIKSDPEMRLDGFAEARTQDGGVIRIESEGLSVWTAWPGDQSEGNLAWMDHRNGRIAVKSPDAAILKKMCSIAEKLGARVQGDEGEIYPDSEADSLREDSIEESPPPSKVPWWKRLLGR
jgi:hypothetical protein